MTKEALKFISDTLKEIVNYEFGMWTSEVQYPYWVGEYNEIDSWSEDGLQEATFILTGFTRGDWSGLLSDKNKIKKKLSYLKVILPNGNGMFINYGHSSMIPLDEEDLKKLQINIQIKEWEV